MKETYQKTNLNNGIKVVTYMMPGKRSAALGIWIKAGGRYETKDNKGIAHVVEHMCFKGSKKYSCRSIKESIEGVGGALNGFTSEELTCYLAKLPSVHSEKALDVLCDMAFHPLLEEEELRKEKTVILEEIKMYKDLPQIYVYDLLDELLWPDHPLGMSIIGSVESVNKTSRQDLSAFINKYYTSSGLVISACGDVDHSRLVGAIESIFSKRNKTEANLAECVSQNQDRPKLKILQKQTEQTHLALGFHSFKRGDPLRHALVLLHIVLGANMSSRLFEELREKRGLAYEIGTQVKKFRDTGAFIVHAGIDNSKVGEAIDLILKEVNRIKGEAVSADEFRRAKEFYLGQLMLALEDTLDHMLWIGESTALLDKTYSLDEIIKEVNKVSLQDITEAAGMVFKQNSLNLALIGPREFKEKEIEGLLHLN